MALFLWFQGLEPFPGLPCFERIKSFHDELCNATCPRDHFLKVIDPLLIPESSYLLIGFNLTPIFLFPSSWRKLATFLRHLLFGGNLHSCLLRLCLWISIFFPSISKQVFVSYFSVSALWPQISQQSAFLKSSIFGILTLNWFLVSGLFLEFVASVTPKKSSRWLLVSSLRFVVWSILIIFVMCTFNSDWEKNRT